MIKTFEQFVSAKYGKPVNEGFQSSKLREIIKQHGLPKNDWDKRMLYDLKDSEIIDVVDNRKEYSAKYMGTPLSKIDWSEEQTFIIELEDGACVVISNLGIDKSHYFLDHIKSAEEQKSDIFKKRHSKRHKGNIGKHGGDDIHKKHLEKVDEIEAKRLAAKLQPNISEIVEKVNSIMGEIDPGDLDEETGTIEQEFTLGGEEYYIYINYKCEYSNAHKRHGVEGYDMDYQVESFEICGEDGCVTNDILGITEETYPDVFEAYTEEDIEVHIYDYYEYYGVKRSDFY